MKEDERKPNNDEGGRERGNALEGGRRKDGRPFLGLEESDKDGGEGDKEEGQKAGRKHVERRDSLRSGEMEGGRDELREETQEERRRRREREERETVRAKESNAKVETEGLRDGGKGEETDEGGKGG